MQHDNPAAASPDRRALIVQATLDSIVTRGVAGTTMRKVADAAGVSLGSITYYFADKDDLLYAAFLEYTNRSVEKFRRYYVTAQSYEAAQEATVRMLIGSAESRQDIIVGTELYSISLRRPRFRAISATWTRRCRAVMAEHFDSDTTFILDALYQGVLLHRSMRLGEYSDERIALGLKRLTPPQSYIGGCPPDKP